jgi:predicted DNA-binding protein with PD1-like motif
MEKAKKGVYKLVECKRGREWIFGVSSGDDLWHALQQFALDNDIKFAKIHAAFMGGFEPAKFMIWAPDNKNPANKHHEMEYELQNLSMLLSLGGIIHLRKTTDGTMEPFPAVHFVIGGGWNVPTVGGHIHPGTIVHGNLRLFITEITGIEEFFPEGDENSSGPEAWYRKI